MWRPVAEALSPTYTVVAADLRGYGDSGKPHPTADGRTYAKRTMAADQRSLMESLGFDRFALIGHDRGARVAHRLALDAPEAVQAIAVLDVVPTLHMFENVDRAMASTYFHWFFLAQDSGVAEKLISAAPEEWLLSRFRGRCVSGEWPVDPDVLQTYLQAFTEETIIASCADYRSAATVDLEDDRADRDAGLLVQAPLLALWGSASYVGRSFDVVAAWDRFAANVRGTRVYADHYLAEENPGATAELLRAFLDAEVQR